MGYVLPAFLHRNAAKSLLDSGGLTSWVVPPVKALAAWEWLQAGRPVAVLSPCLCRCGVLVWPSPLQGLRPVVIPSGGFRLGISGGELPLAAIGAVPVVRMLCSVPGACSSGLCMEHRSAPFCWFLMWWICGGVCLRLWRGSQVLTGASGGVSFSLAANHPLVAPSIIAFYLFSGRGQAVIFGRSKIDGHRRFFRCASAIFPVSRP